MIEKTVNVSCNVRPIRHYINEKCEDTIECDYRINKMGIDTIKKEVEKVSRDYNVNISPFINIEECVRAKFICKVRTDVDVYDYIKCSIVSLEEYVEFSYDITELYFRGCMNFTLNITMNDKRTEIDDIKVKI